MAASTTAEPMTGPLGSPLRRLAGVPAGVLLAGAVLTLIVLAAALPGLLAGGSPTAIHPADALRGPGAGRWFGTDELGRDQFTRVVHGTRPSLLLGIGSTFVAIVGGAALGLLAGLGGRAADELLMRVADVALALPALLLALLVITVTGTGTVNVMAAVGLAFVPGYARVVRAEALIVRRSGYAEAGVTLGLPRAALVWRHIMPNALAPLLTLATVGFGTSLISASTLSFLGLGPRPPSPEWGAMLSQSRTELSTAWWMGLFPGVAVTLTVIVVTTVGRYLQRRFTRRGTP